MRALRAGLLALLALAVTAGPGRGQITTPAPTVPQAVYRIEAIANEVPGPLVFVRVGFWNSQAGLDAGKLPECINDFRMMLFPTATSPVFDKDGNALTKSGKWVGRDEMGEWLTTPDDPIVMQTYNRDNVADIRSNVERWWKNDYLKGKVVGRPLPVDGKDTRITVDHESKAGVMVKPDVTALIGKAFEVAK